MVLVDLVPDLRGAQLFVVENVFLEELVVPVLVAAVKQAVSLYLVVPEALLLVVEVGVFSALDVVLVGLERAFYLFLLLLLINVGIVCSLSLIEGLS